MFALPNVRPTSLSIRNEWTHFPFASGVNPHLFVEAHQPLLRRLAIGVLNDGREQLERIAMRFGRAANARVDKIQLDPSPA